MKIKFYVIINIDHLLSEIRLPPKPEIRSAQLRYNTKISQTSVIPKSNEKNNNSQCILRNTICYMPIFNLLNNFFIERELLATGRD